MKILIKNAKIIDNTSKYHKKNYDIEIKNGVINKIKKNIQTKGYNKIINFKNLHISKGWVDLNCRFGEPTNEIKETFESGINSAIKGGFTHLMLMPSASLVSDNKTSIEYVLSKTKNKIVSIHPIGSLTMNSNGSKMTELYDLYKSGAIGFSDDKKSIQNSFLMKEILLYVKTFNGLVMTYPNNFNLNNNGYINEGLNSLKYGLRGIPRISEEIQVMRDIFLCEETNSKIHFSTISTKKSVDLIRDAKLKGLKITSDVSSYHLHLNENDMKFPSTNFKVFPPLRSKTDTLELINGLKDGTIDSISSNHNPQNIECKDCEFELANFGIINLETSFSICNTFLSKYLNLETLIDKMSTTPRLISKINLNSIKEGNIADITLFDPDLNWNYNIENINSLSKNTPYINYNFKGKVHGIINNKKIKIFD